MYVVEVKAVEMNLHHQPVNNNDDSMHVFNIFHMYPQAMYGVKMKAVEMNLHHQPVLSVGRNTSYHTCSPVCSRHIRLNQYA